MKKISTLLVCLCAIIKAIAQFEPICQPSEVRTYYLNGDSITHTYQFNDQGLVSKDTKIHGNITQRTDYLYNLQNNIIRSTMSIAGYEMVSVVEIFEYESNGIRLVRKHCYEQLPFNTNDHYIYDYDYDDNERLDKIVYRIRNPNTASLTSISRHVYEYNGNITVRTLEMNANIWLSDEWILDGNSTRETFFYDEFGRNTRYELETYQNDTTFVKLTASDYEYDENGSVSRITNYEWNGETWFVTNRTVRIFEDYLITQAIHYLYINGEPIEHKMSVYNYDGNNLINTRYQDWNGTTWTDGTMSDIDEIVFSSPYLTRIEDITSKADSITKIEVLSYIETNSPNVSVNENNTLTVIDLYPNPASGIVSVCLDDNTICQSVEIFSLDGRLVKAQSGNFNAIDISSLASGLYIMKVRMSNGKEYNERILKSN